MTELSSFDSTLVFEATHNPFIIPDMSKQIDLIKGALRFFLYLGRCRKNTMNTVSNF